jgi:hypothetical protein
VSALTRIRSIPKAIEAIKAQDPQSYINETYLRGLLRDGKIPYHKAGKRFLVDIDLLIAYMVTPSENQKEAEETDCKIRRVK